VHAPVSYWDRASGCCHISVDQIFVIPTMAKHRSIFLFMCVVGVNWFFTVSCYRSNNVSGFLVFFLVFCL
jgi:hypothetical protein